jgi:serine protease Do
MRFWFSLIALNICFSAPLSALEFNPKNIYQQTSKAVVLIAALEKGDQEASTGTGSILNKDGLILTNAHVIFNSEKNKIYGEIKVFLKPTRVTGNLKKDTARKFKARLIRYSNELDLALLQIKNPPPIDRLPFLKLSNLKEISIGDPVLAIGHPEQGGLWTLTTGTISSLIENHGDIPGKDVFQTETSINKGNSGGPLIDRYGNIVGINSMIARKGSGNIAITDINFSIQSTVAVKWMNSVGQPFTYAITPKAPKDDTNTMTDNAGIVPVPKRNKIQSEMQPVLEQEKLELKETNKPQAPVEPEILTERHPYEEQDLFQAVEDEMEDMMQEMKGRIQSR